jgi:hypothetical protein
MSVCCVGVTTHGAPSKGTYFRLRARNQILDIADDKALRRTDVGDDRAVAAGREHRLGRGHDGPHRDAENDHVGIGDRAAQIERRVVHGAQRQRFLDGLAVVRDANDPRRAAFAAGVNANRPAHQPQTHDAQPVDHHDASFPSSLVFREPV